MWILRLLKPLSKRQRVENVRIKIATCRYHWGIMLNTYARSRYLKAAKFAVLIPGPGMLVNVRNAPRVVIPPPSETPPVSACKPLCAILLRKPSVYPLSPVKANVGRLCEKLKNALKSGLEQRCAGNFLAIFVEVILWYFDRLRKAPALLAPEPSLSLTSQVQRKF